jgi:long-chain acyl-CoA synthetase
VKDKGKIAETLFKIGLSVSYAYNGIGWDKGKGLGFLLKPLVKLFDIILFRKIREGFGGRLKFFIGGGALLDIGFQRFFYALGIPMFQGYGLTEAAPVISSNSERKHKLGSSGYLVEELDLKICDEEGKELPVGEKGEIVVRGENVMVGYWENKEATEETIKNEWLHTGDLGHMDKDGFLYVLGRFKSLLIADDGEKFSPEGIEEAFVSHSKHIDQCMMYNNQKPYSVVLIVPARESLRNWTKINHIETSNEEGLKKVLEHIEQYLNEYRKGGKYDNMFPQRWLPASIGIIPEPFSEQNRMINSTTKMVRPKITEHYQELLDYMYTPDGKNSYNPKNIEAIKKLLSE